MPHQIYQFDGITPRIHLKAYVHPSAVIIGDVHIEEDCYIGPNAVLRGDNGSIRLKRMCNVQDSCVLHSAPKGRVIIHPMAQVGHGAVLHGCEIKQNALIGIHSTVLDLAIVGQNTVVAAGSLVPKGKVLTDDSLYLGNPVNKVRQLEQHDIEKMRSSAMLYVINARDYNRKLKRVTLHEAHHDLTTGELNALS